MGRTDESTEHVELLSQGHKLIDAELTSCSSESRTRDKSAEFRKNRRTFRTMLARLAISTLFGVACVVLAILVRFHKLPFDPIRYSNGNLRPNLTPPYLREILLLALNLAFRELSTRPCSLAHGMALKWKLANEKDEQTGKMRLEFNSNLRLLQSSNDRRSANGWPSNVVLTLCLTIGYGASGMVLLGMERENESYNTILSSITLYVLGLSTISQSAIAFYAIYETKTDILSWSRSPFVMAKTLLDNGFLTRQPGRCMRGLYDLHREGPKKPDERQRPIWVTYPQFRQFTMYIWMIVVAGYYWAFIIWGMMYSGTQGSHRGDDWNIIPSSPSDDSKPTPMSKQTGLMNFGWEGEAPAAGILWGLGILVGFQGGMITTALTCAESIAQAVGDERRWREAGQIGAHRSPGFFRKMKPYAYRLVLSIAEPGFHWLYGLAVGVNADAGFQFRPVQILYLVLFGTAGAIYLTAVGMRHHPPTSQPSTYGHLQTLVNLIDEWHDESDTLHWGHKWDNHAGTSKDKLEPVKLEMYYGYCDRPGC